MREDTIRLRFGDRDTTGPVRSSPLADSKDTARGLKFYFTQPGHIVVPGLTGEAEHWTILIILNGGISRLACTRHRARLQEAT